jgi:2,4-dienoyl-CoA reductase-like NADH-dependent reductase (Old Yellow Enzyme family)/thioredoxin reductase
MEKEVKNDPLLNTVEKPEKTSRRSFLSGTGGVALAVAATSLLGDRASGQSSGVASEERAAGKPSVPAKTAAPKMSKSIKYPHLLSPMKIGNHVLKNRIIGTPAAPHYLVGPDGNPTEAIMHGYANTARAGAAIVVLSQPIAIHPNNEEDVLKLLQENLDVVNPDHGTNAGHFPTWDLANAGTQNLMSQLTEAVHFYGSLCLMKPMMRMTPGFDVSATKQDSAMTSTRNSEVSGAVVTAAPPVQVKKEASEEILGKVIESAVLQAVLAKECGFDGLWLHCAYREAPTARMMSPLTNRRTDQYGGSIENRARFNIQIFDAIKKRCGQDFFLMVAMSGCEPEGGYTLDDGAEFAKQFAGHIDLLELKGDPGERDSTPSNFVPGKTPFLFMSEHYKKKGVPVPVITSGGFTNLDWAEDALATGKLDAVGMCRALIANRDLIQLVVEGRNEDVRPCIRCNACYGNGEFNPWNSTCAINPVWGLEHKIDRMIAPSADKKRVAVIGGGPAGMEAALIAAQRGHSVTLYEKTGRLGGTFNTFENVSFKWPHKDYKDYMVRQIGKSGVKVRLNTEADAELIARENYDAVLVAIGADPAVPEIPGIKGKNVLFARDVYGKESMLAKDVVVIGGGSVGVETGMVLAEKGHNVTVLEKTNVMAGDAAHSHFYERFEYAWKQLPTFKPVVQAICNGITEDGVTYLNADGKQQTIKAGSVVVAMGAAPRTDQALKFAGTSGRFYLVGDCKEAADLRNAIRSAFSTASLL